MTVQVNDQRRLADPRTLPTWVDVWHDTVTRNYGRTGGHLQAIGHIFAAVVSGKLHIDLCVWRDRHYRREWACTMVEVPRIAALERQVRYG